MERRGRHTEQRPHGMCCSGELFNKLCRDFCNWLGGMHRAICTTAFRGQQAEQLDAWSIVCEAMLMTAPLRDWTKPRSTYFCACFIRTWADAFAFIGDPRLKVGQLHTCSISALESFLCAWPVSEREERDGRGGQAHQFQRRSTARPRPAGAAPSARSCAAAIRASIPRVRARELPPRDTSTRYLCPCPPWFHWFRLRPSPAAQCTGGAGRRDIRPFRAHRGRRARAGSWQRRERPAQAPAPILHP